MSDKPVQVEVLDADGRTVVRDGRAVMPAKAKPKERSLAHPMNLAMFLCALLAAFGILLIAVGTVLEERARQLGRRKDDE